jgi:hypothetical protein
LWLGFALVSLPDMFSYCQVLQEDENTIDDSMEALKGLPKGRLWFEDLRIATT